MQLLHLVAAGLAWLALAAATYVPYKNEAWLRRHFKDLLKTWRPNEPKSPLKLSYDEAVRILNPHFEEGDHASVVLFNYYALFLGANGLLERTLISSVERDLLHDLLYLAKARFYADFRAEHHFRQKSVVDLRQLEEFEDVTLTRVGPANIARLMRLDLIDGMVDLLEQRSFIQSDSNWPFESTEKLKRAWKWDLAYLFLLYTMLQPEDDRVPGHSLGDI